MKKLLIFNASEDYEFTCANYGADYYHAICEHDEWLRQQLKYRDDLSEVEVRLLELSRRNLNDLIEDIPRP